VSDKLSIIATTFPQYDWMPQILGDVIEGATLTLLIDDGVDLHSYQPSVEDIAKLSNCDMFIHVGGLGYFSQM
jgi:zinc transport system substrate-binding protein